MSRMLEDRQHERREMRADASTARKKRRSMLLRRVRLARSIMLFVILTMVVALVRLQAFTSPDAFPDIKAASTKTIPVIAVRGTITDRSGVALAMTIEVRDVFADQRLIADPAMEAAQLSPILGIDRKTLQDKLTGQNAYVMLKRGVSQEDWARILELELPGIGGDRAQRRAYPEGMAVANILGRLNFDGEATEGLELQFNELLSGINGTRRNYGSLSIGTDESLTPAIDGAHLMLTIDRDIQTMAQIAIAEKVKESRSDSGSVIVMNAKTGEILAMATAPTYDPQNITPETQAFMGNRVLSESYEPGSTGKVMTMAALLDSGEAAPNSRFIVPDSLKVYGGKLSDHKNHPPLHLTLTGILAKSSNVGTVKAAKNMSRDELFSYFQKFGIGKFSGLKFPNETSGRLAPASEWSPLDTANKMFGQGYQVNLLQAAGVFATIANDGVRMQPTLVAGHTDRYGTFNQLTRPAGVRVIKKEVAQQVREMMESVVSEDGTAPMAQIPGYRVAGKTGTAQIWNVEKQAWKGYVASFIGFAPADKPELVVAVQLVKPKNGHFGGQLAGPVFKKVMKFALTQMRIPTTGEETPRLQLTW